MPLAKIPAREIRREQLVAAVDLAGAVDVEGQKTFVAGVVQATWSFTPSPLMSNWTPSAMELKARPWLPRSRTIGSI